MASAYFVSGAAGHAELLAAIAYSVVTTMHVREAIRNCTTLLDLRDLFEALDALSSGASCFSNGPAIRGAQRVAA